MAIHLRGLPGDCTLVEGRTGRPCPTLGLAPGGVYRADPVARVAGALLPHRFTLACAGRSPPSAVCSLWHFPAGRPDWPLASTLPCGAPTFLDPVPRCTPHEPEPRPPGRLTVAPSVPGPGPGGSRARAVRRAPALPGPDGVPRPSSVPLVGAGRCRVTRATRAGRPCDPWVGCAPWCPTDATSATAADAPLHRRPLQPGRRRAGAGLPAQPAHSGCAARSRASPTSTDRPLLPRPGRPRVGTGAAGPGAAGQVLADDLGPARGTLGQEGIELAARAWWWCCAATLDFYRARAEIGFVMAELDVTALLGRMAAKRAALLRTLAAEGLLERNRRSRCPRSRCGSGWWRSPGTEGYRDFVGPARSARAWRSASPWCPATVQGPGARAADRHAPLAPAAAGRSVRRWSVVVRGGGSKADLAAFDTEPVARAVADVAGAGVDGHRPHRRRVGGRHRGQPVLHHPDRVRPRAGAAGGPSGGRSRWRPAPARCGPVRRREVLSRSRAPQTRWPGPAGGRGPPPGARPTRSGWPPVPASPAGDARQAGRRAAQRRSDRRSARLGPLARHATSHRAPDRVAVLAPPARPPTTSSASSSGATR